MTFLGSIKIKYTLSLLFITALATLQASAFSVILDPGHGGKDYGAKGNFAYEKNINLDVAKLVVQYLNKNFADLDVLMTRSDDTYFTLKERADFANSNAGDLFVSIHVNSVDKKNRNRANIHGASVYTLGLHKSDANFEVAKRENSVISLDPDFTTNYEGFDPESSESYIIFEMGQNKHMGQSINLAQNIQNELIATAGRADRGIRQAGFWVLWATGMPSVLVELDFICNPTAEKFLTSQNGQKKMATAIGRAIGNYAASHADIAMLKKEVSFEYTDDVITIAESADTDLSMTPNTTGSNVPVKNSTTVKDIDKMTYHVQILASSKQLKKNSSELKGEKAVEFREGKWYKYYIGRYNSQKEAQKQLVKLKKKFPDAFIIKMRKGKRVTE